MRLFRPGPIDRDIARLALPALGALIAEPLFLLVDTAFVGHIGTVELAGVSIASAVLQTVVGLLIFLAYSTTPAVARLLGSGDRRGAMQAGVDGMWLAVALGVLLVAVGAPLSRPLVDLFGAPSAVSEQGATYLSISLLGLPALLLTFAATGLLRGLQDTRTPLVVAGVGFALNALLNWVFIFGFDWGVAGSAAGTVVASWLMAAAYVVVAVRAARTSGASLVLRPRGMLAAAHTGSWLLLRTASLRVAMLATIVVATRSGVDQLATMQIALTIFGALALALDALAIAGQAIVGRGLGALDVPLVRATARRLLQISVLGAVLIGVLLAAISPFIGTVFTEDPEIRSLLGTTVLIMAVGLPLAGLVFVLDGVLIGAGDARYLALTGILNLGVYLPLLALIVITRPEGALALIALWLAFGFGYIGARGLTLWLRFIREKWLVTGVR